MVLQRVCALLFTDHFFDWNVRAGATEETVHAGTAGDFDARQEVVVRAPPFGRPQRLRVLRRTAAPARPAKPTRRRVRGDAPRRRLPNGRVASARAGRRASIPPTGPDVARDDVLCRLSIHVDATDGVAQSRTSADVPLSRGPKMRPRTHDVLLLRRL